MVATFVFRNAARPQIMNHIKQNWEYFLGVFRCHSICALPQCMSSPTTICLLFSFVSVESKQNWFKRVCVCACMCAFGSSDSSLIEKKRRDRSKTLNKSKTIYADLFVLKYGFYSLKSTFSTVTRARRCRRRCHSHTITWNTFAICVYTFRQWAIHFEWHNIQSHVRKTFFLPILLFLLSLRSFHSINKRNTST